MDLLVTVIDPGTDTPRCRDVAIHADPGVRLGDIAAALAVVRA